MTKYLDPKNDLLFKKIFGEHKELLISFLNAFLPLGDRTIQKIEYLSPEQVPGTPLGKHSIVDVRCMDDTDRIFIVEMQMEWSNIFRKRLLVNGSKAVIKQIEKKNLDDKMKKYREIEPVYILAVINSIFSEGIDWHHHLKIVDPKHPEVVIDGLDYVLLELPKFKPETWSLAEKKMAILWLRFLREIDEGYTETIPKELESNKFIHTAIEMCKESALSAEERDVYERYQEAVRWEASIKDLEDRTVKNEETIEKNKKVLAEKDKFLAEKDKSLAEKDRSLAEKDKSLAEKDREIAELRKLLEK
jgi:predicted transposase/invertase (TIGR01784 family)